ncbi:hypothetical protein KC360_g1952 [Hortaea werneckii]|nr:hypothetical protein KC361_g6660 [Hortaea werneckii]KAI6886849.1 hypothetical protein KC325_g2532 [Hortaea werneckii]KAI6997017.1 hypothetical protein KC359_g3182 [Hortaea werneckii]KAI7148085.1 hypothetical protein KC344_g2209 [Hortaea werneckii]KAI7177955.1 hypothetical protein KC360_g1952 [Hortaea werneckii]
MHSNGYSTAFLDQYLPSYEAYSQFTGHGLQLSRSPGQASTKRARRTSTPSSERGNSRSPCDSARGAFGNDGIKMDTSEAAQQERFSLIQALQAHLEHEIQQYLQADPPMDDVAELWSGQITANRRIANHIQDIVTFPRSEGWNDRGRPSNDGSRILRRRLNGDTEVLRPFLILELEDVSSWKCWYKDAERYRVDGPNGTAFTGKHLAISLGIEFGGQMEVVFGHSSGGKAISKLNAEDCRHKFVLCDETEVDYVRANVPIGMTIVPTTGFRYHVYGVFDMTQTRKIDCDNRFRVKLGRPTDVGIALICKLRAKVNAAYQTSVDSSNEPIKQRTDGGLFAEPPFEPTERNVKLWYAALDAKDARSESLQWDTRRRSKAPVIERRLVSRQSVVDALPLNRKRRAEDELEPGEIEQEAVSGAEEHVVGNCARGSANKRPKLSDYQNQLEFKIKGNATRGTRDYTTERPVSSQSQAFRSDRPTEATMQPTDLEQATSRVYDASCRKRALQARRKCD